MSDNEQDEIDQIHKLMAEELAKSPNPIAIHEAGHAVVALHVGLSLEGVDIEERDTPEGPKFGRAKVRSIAEDFSATELREHSPAVVERVRKQIIMLLAGEAATKLIRERPGDPRAQFDHSQIAGLLREFPELQPEVPDLRNTAEHAVSMRRADIEKLAAALVEWTSMSTDQVCELLGK